MAEFFRNKKGIGYLEVSFIELMEYSKNGFPVCDECLKDIIGCNIIMLIPILNEAFCPACAQKRLDAVADYPEDRPFRERRENFYKQFFGLV